MSLFKPPYLRVRSPQTVNGTDLKIDEETEKVIYKETHLPLTAKKFLEEENRQLPNSLKHKLEVVGEGSEGPVIPEEKKIQSSISDEKTIGSDPDANEFQQIGNDLKAEKAKPKR